LNIILKVLNTLITQHPDKEWSNPFFIKVAISTIVSALVLIAFVNIIANPYAIYGTSIIPRPPGMYEKKFILFDDYNPPPQALILSNSHIMTFNPDVVEDITGERCFNFWLPGACTETYYALLKMVLEQKHDDIDMIIVGTGIEAFHPTLAIQPEARFLPEISQYFIHDRFGQATIFDKIGLLFTIDQFRQATALIVANLRHRLNEDYHPGQVKLEYMPNGMTLQASAEALIAQGTFNLEERIQQRLRSKRYTEEGPVIRGWTGISETRKKYWIDFLGLCRENNIRLFVFMAPVHPLLLQLAAEQNTLSMFDELDEYLSETVAEYGGIYRNYLDVASWGGDPDEFYDEIHMRPRNSDLLLRHLLEEYEQTQNTEAD
jgi:hypothetical protein